MLSFINSILYKKKENTPTGNRQLRTGNREPGTENRENNLNTHVYWELILWLWHINDEVDISGWDHIQWNSAIKTT